MSKHLQFSVDDYRARIAALQDQMAHRGIDAILVSSQANFQYLTGIQTEVWVNLSRPMAVWVPSAGLPIAVTADIEHADACITSWLDDVRSYPSDWAPRGEPIFGQRQTDLNALFADQVIAIGCDIRADQATTIGIEQGGNMRWGGTLAALDQVRQAFPNAEWRDASGALWECRLVKSRAEVDIIRRAVKTLDRAYADLFPAVTAGLSEADVVRLLRRLLLQHGADHVGYSNVSANIRVGMMGSSTPHVLERGEMLYVDGGAFIGGYCSDYNRLASIGPASDAQRKAYDILVEAHHRALDAVKPGIRCSDVATVINQVFESRGTEIGVLGRYGHGIGLEQPEPPNIQLVDKTVIREGMVLAVEPNLFIPEIGYLTLEDNVVVTSDGCEILSAKAPACLPEVDV